MPRRLFLLLFFLLLVSSAWATEDSVAELERQKLFLAHSEQKTEQEKLRQTAENQAEAKRRAIREKQAQLAQQFAGLSQKLSRLPAPPHFSGELQEETTDERLKTKD